MPGLDKDPVDTFHNLTRLEPMCRHHVSVQHVLVGVGVVHLGLEVISCHRGLGTDNPKVMQETPP